MCSRDRCAALGGLALAASVWSIASAQPQSVTYEIGRAATSAEIRDWGTNIGPNGSGLPAGGATAADGKGVYQRTCARCHGLTGTEGPMTASWEAVVRSPAIAAPEDRGELLAVCNDALGLCEPRNAVRPAWLVESGRGVRCGGVRIVP